jgi:hypothetical protein
MNKINSGIPMSYKNKCIFGEDAQDSNLSVREMADLVADFDIPFEEVKKRIDNLPNSDFAALMCCYENGETDGFPYHVVNALAELSEQYFNKE